MDGEAESRPHGLYFISWNTSWSGWGGRVQNEMQKPWWVCPPSLQRCSVRACIPALIVFLFGWQRQRALNAGLGAEAVLGNRADLITWTGLMQKLLGSSFLEGWELHPKATTRVRLKYLTKIVLKCKIFMWSENLRETKVKLLSLSLSFRGFKELIASLKCDSVVQRQGYFPLISRVSCCEGRFKLIKVI